MAATPVRLRHIIHLHQVVALPLHPDLRKHIPRHLAVHNQATMPLLRARRHHLDPRMAITIMRSINNSNIQHRLGGTGLRTNSSLTTASPLQEGTIITHLHLGRLRLVVLPVATMADIPELIKDNLLTVGSRPMDSPNNTATAGHTKMFPFESFVSRT
jgi:hypothetical protein